MEISKKLSLVNRTVQNSRKIKYIVIHYVGAVSSAKANADYFYDKDRQASAHYFVDEKEIWQVVDDSNSAWHVGAKKYYNDCRNGNSIGVELCCKKDNQGNWYFEKQTVDNAVELVRYLMELHGIKIEDVIRHYDVTRKICPEPFVRDEKAWKEFKERIIKKMTTKEITDIKEALDYLAEKGRISNKEYWKKAIECVRNQEFVFIKWANDVKQLIG